MNTRVTMFGFKPYFVHGYQLFLPTNVLNDNIRCTEVKWWFKFRRNVISLLYAAIINSWLLGCCWCCSGWSCEQYSFTCFTLVLLGVYSCLCTSHVIQLSRENHSRFSYSYIYLKTSLIWRYFFLNLGPQL